MDHSEDNDTPVDVLTQEEFTQIIIRRQKLASSANIRRTMLLESATLMLDDDTRYDDLFGKHGGSKPGKKPNIPRNFEAAYQQLYQHSFSDTPLYDSRLFRRRFRMSKELFLKITDSV
ncbi:hypothetical protein PGTUg99_007007 [Puccinia graminis f. sp. tritici]|uniref:Uncharacterized protein n=1 Tax=Puccinia graminis f. sp. tritici TaxID=56615 RepID=A0A5B0PE97_PUCGR|nr:hypothetical protein PGTUg99_007007 [Puccinia graminis f. sp. tritici]